MRHHWASILQAAGSIYDLCFRADAPLLYSNFLIVSWAHSFLSTYTTSTT